MKKTFKWTLLTIMAVLSLTLLLLALEEGKDEKAEERESAAKPASPVSVLNGQTVITLPSDVQTRLGLGVASLNTSSYRGEQRLPAFVLPVQDLAELRNGYVAANAKLQKAIASMQVSQKEYERLKRLYSDNQNASAKAFEAAEGMLVSDEAEAQAAEQDLRIQENVVRQRWGVVVAGWIVQNSGSLTRVLEQRDFLFQITVPAGSSSTAAHSVLLELPSGSAESATLVSTFPRIDSRIQGASFLYVVPAEPGIAAGMNLVARLAQGAVRKGVVVPDSAAVWWEGRAWVYQQTGASTFARREIPPDSPTKGGLFVASGFSPGDKVVVRGAESLLSTELGSQVLGEQGEEDEQ